jgi:hypothetical protein
VAVAGLSAGLTKGLDGALTGGTAAAPTYAGLSGTGAVVARAAVGNALMQGVSIAVRLQDGFNWRSVVASGAAAGVGAIVENKLVSNGMDRASFGVDLAKNAGSSATQQLVQNGRISLATVASDAFGNALGMSVARSVVEANAQAKLAKARYQERQNIARDGTDYFADKLMAGGMGVMEATVRSRSDELQDTVGIIRAMAYAENQAGTNFDDLPISEQTAILREALSANSRSGLTITEGMRERADGVDPQIGSGAIQGSSIPDTIVVVGNRDLFGGFVATAANVLDRANSAVASLIDSVGAGNAEAAVWGIQLAVGGVPRTALTYAGNYVLGGVRHDLSEQLSGLIAENAFDVSSADPDRAADIWTVSRALGTFGVDTAFGTAANVIQSTLGTRSILNATRSTPNSRLLRSRGSWEGEPGNGLWHSMHPDVNAVTGGKPIPFVNGRPDFSEWTRQTIHFRPGVLDGTASDFSAVHRAIQRQHGFSSPTAAENFLREQGLTAHHLDATTIQLVPSALHNNIPHIGAASDLRGGR